MWDTLGIIVYAHDREGAESDCKDVMTILLDHGYSHWEMVEDYDIGPGVSGKFIPQPAGTEESKKIMSALMDYQKTEFFYNVNEIRKLLIMPDEDLFENMDIRMRMASAGCYKGPGVYLYDKDAEGIRTQEGLKEVLGKWPSFIGAMRDRFDAMGDPWLVLVQAHH